jgi:hypothetical protein
LQVLGQCDDKRPSLAWHEAADAAIGAVAIKEGCPVGKLRVVEVKALVALYPEIIPDIDDVKIKLATHNLV